MSGRKKFYLCNQGNVHLLNVGQTKIGRHNSNTILINDIKITRFHAVVHNTGKYILVEDLNSANGTYVNGRLLTPRCPKQLFKNDVIIFGNGTEEYELFVFRVVEQFEHARSDYKPLTEQEKIRLNNLISAKKSNAAIADDISLSDDEDNVALNDVVDYNETLRERRSREHRSSNKMIETMCPNKKTTSEDRKRSNKSERTRHQKIKEQSALAVVGKRKQSSSHSASDENFFSEDRSDYSGQKNKARKKARISDDSNVLLIKEEKESTLSETTSVDSSENNSVNDCTMFADDESAIDADNSLSQRSLYAYTLEDEIIYVDSDDDDIVCLSQRHSFSQQQQSENSLSLISEQSNNSLEMMDIDNDMKCDDYMDTETKWFETLMHIDIDAFQTVVKAEEVPFSDEDGKMINSIKHEVVDNVDDAQTEPIASDGDDCTETAASEDEDDVVGSDDADVTAVASSSTAADDTENYFTKTDIGDTATTPNLNERTLRSGSKKRWTVTRSVSHVPPVKKHSKTGRGDFLLDVPPLPVSVGTITNAKSKTARPKPVSADVKRNNDTTMDVDGIVNTVQRISLRDNIMSVAGVAVDTPDATVNLNVIVNKSNELVAKKSVSFSTVDDIRSIPANAEVTVKRSNENVPHRRYEFFEQLIVELAAAFENAIYRICKWNVIWLVQQVDGMPPPPLYPDEGFINEKCGLFTSINTYAEKMKYLLFHEMWYGMLREWRLRNDMAFPYTQNMTSHNSVLSYGIVEKVCKERTHYRKSAHKVLEPRYFSFPNFWTLSLYRVLSEDEYTSDGICNGQLLILNLKVSNEEKGRTMIFAYVCYESRVIISSINHNASKYDLNICNGQPYAIQYLNIKVPERSFDIIPGSKIKLKPFTLIKAPTTRLFSALSLIENTPIHGALILPQFHNFNIDKHIELDNSIDKFLCPYQKDAVTMCLNMCLSDKPNLCLVDGAAGSGKTQVIVSLISQLFNGSCVLPEDRKLNMLVVTKNEYEADDLVIRISKAQQKYLKKKRCSVVRYGQMSATSSRVAEYYLDNLVDKLINDKPENILNLSEEINCTKAQINAYKQALQSTKMNNELKEKITMKLKNSESFLSVLKSGDAYKNPHYLQTLKKNAYFSILQSADVVVTTYNSCWSSRSDVYFIPSAFNRGDIVKFDTCVMDDSAQNTEIHGLIAVMFRINHLILVGDSGQLTIPTSLPSFPEFERVIKSQDESMYFRFLRCRKSSAVINRPDVCVLRSQFRMNPVIFQWPNTFFYSNSKHTNMTSNKCDKDILPYLIINHCYLKDDYGNTNDDEIKLIAMIAESIGAVESLKRLRIAVIVSNRDQVEAARPHMLIAQQIWNNQIIVCTMDDCFGRQYDIVIISMVEIECNFPVSDTVWLNRILTRATVSLLICGNFKQLKQNRALDMLVNNAETRGVLRYIESPVHRISTDAIRSLILRV